jgi:hypothetical protein
MCVCCCPTGTSELLSAAAGVFAQQGAALQAQKAHSSYQRSVAGTLARLRVMHVLEDTSTGEAGLQSLTFSALIHPVVLCSSCTGVLHAIRHCMYMTL